MSMEREEQTKRDDELFRQMMLAVHPDRARQIMSLFDNAEREQQEAAVQQFIPEGREEVEDILKDIRRFGISLRTD